MLWLMTMGRRLNGVYAAFMLVAFMMGVAGALQAPTLSLFLSREVGAQPFWVGLFYTVNAIAGILVSLALAKRSDNRGDRRKLILFCCAMAVGNALLFAFNRHYLTLITCGVLLASLANTAMPQLFALAREYADNSAREVVMFSSVTQALPHVRAGRIKMLAVGASSRSAAVPEIPTVIESGFPGYEMYVWWGITAPAGVPRDRAAKLYREITAVLQDPSTRKWLEQHAAAEAQISKPAEIRTMIRADLKKWTEVARTAGIKVK